MLQTTSELKTVRGVPRQRAIARTKFEVIEEALLDQIATGQYRVGVKLPSERKLAKEFDVSTITVKKAIANLVERGLLFNRPRVGTYIGRQAIKNLEENAIYLIAHSYECPTSRMFYSEGRRIAESAGMKLIEVRIARDNHEEIANIIMSGACSVVISASLEPDGVIAKAMSQSQGKSVLISGRLDSVGVHSVMGDDRHMIRIGLKYLQDRGHTKIGMICCNRENYVERERIAAWLAHHSSDVRDADLMRQIIDMNLPEGEVPVELAYTMVSKAIRSQNWDVTALICPDDETVMGVVSACRDCHVRIPEEMEIISIGNTYYAEHLSPRITSLDPDLKRQLELGFALATASHEDLSHECLLHAVEPQLIERDSTSARTNFE